jgi:hypothetical protein
VENDSIGRILQTKYNTEISEIYKQAIVYKIK